jgi:hypothetical protein
VILPTYADQTDPSNTEGALSASNPCAIGNYCANFQVFGGGTTGWASRSSIAIITAAHGTANTMFFTTRYGICTYGASLWVHGNWNWAYMAMFAYNS